MNSKWFWKPVLVGAVIFGVLGCLLLALLLAALSGGRYSADTLSKDLVTFGLPSLALGALIGAGLGAVYAVIRKRVQGRGEEPRQTE